MDDYSIVEIFEGQNEGHKCGYCKSTDGSLSYGMWGHSLTVKNYQDLIDRGWRRSGKYCYKPLMQQTCCPQYTIRCSVSDFKLTKSQKKVLRRMHRFLSVGSVHQDADKEANHFDDDEIARTPDSIDAEHLQEKASLANKNLEDKQLESITASAVTRNAVEEVSKVVAMPKAEEASAIKPSTNADGNRKCTEPVKMGSGPCPNKPPCKKAKLLRMERRLEKLAKQKEGCLVNNVKPKEGNVAKTLQDYLAEPLPQNAAHHLELKLIRSGKLGAESEHYFDQIYELYKLYQITIHEDVPDRCSIAQFKRFLVSSPLEVTTVRSWPQSGLAEESYNVYCQYQCRVHCQTEAENNKETYTEFLVDSPLKPEDIPAVSGHQGYGSFHQQYWLDGKLIAVGVIDILPACVSSVYFFYDPRYGFLSLGTYGALREIAFTQELSKITPELRFYYMGFYIHTCVKMCYKGQFQSSYLLCPEVYTWHPIEKARTKLDASSYSRLEDRNIEDEDGKVTLDDIMVLHRRTAMIYRTYDSLKLIRNLNESQEVLIYAKYVGKKCTRRTLLYRS